MTLLWEDIDDESLIVLHVSKCQVQDVAMLHEELTHVVANSQCRMVSTF